MPRLTCSASLRRCALQGVSSDQVLQMPLIDPPSNTYTQIPWFFTQLLYRKACLSELQNHWVEGSLRCGGVMVGRRERSGGKGWWQKGMAGAGGPGRRGRGRAARFARGGRGARGRGLRGVGWVGGSMVRGGGSDLVLVVDIHQHGGEQHHALDDLLVVDAYAQDGHAVVHH